MKITSYRSCIAAAALFAFADVARPATNAELQEQVRQAEIGFARSMAAAITKPSLRSWPPTPFS